MGQVKQRKLVIHFLITLMFLPVQAYAFSSIESKFKMLVPGEKLFHHLFENNGKFSGKIDQKKEELQAGKDQKFSLYSTRFQSEYRAKVNSQFLSQGMFMGSLGFNGFNIEAGNMHIDIERREFIRGNWITIRNNIQCGDLVISSSKPVIFSWNSRINIEPNSISLSDLKLNTVQRLQDLNISYSLCRGIEGNPKQIKKLVTDYILNNSAVDSLLMDFAKESAEKQISKVNATFFSMSKIVQNKDIQWFIQPTAVGEPKRFEYMIEGKIYVLFQSRSTTSHEKIGEELVLKDLDPREDIQLVVPSGFLKSISEAIYLSRSMTYKTDTNSHRELRKLMGSRFKQGFVWKDFRSFPKNSNIKLDSSLLSVSSSEFDVVDDRDSSLLQFNTKIVSQTKLLAPVDGNHIDYAKLIFNLSLLVDINTIGSSIFLNPNLSSIDSRHLYEPSYLAKYEVRDKVSHKRIKKIVTDSINKQEIQIGPVEIGQKDGMNFKLSKLEKKAEQSYIVFIFKP
ncbi:MAG: hypothetical protein AB8E15_05040 [Bdellovibrionales bacterium]